MVTEMAVVIQFYVPERFRKQNGKWIPSPQRRDGHSLSSVGKEVGMT
jgi:hypothetical protein